MRKVLLMSVMCLLLSTTPAWGTPQKKEASADSYLQIFMKSGIDCGVVIEDATHGDFGLPDPKKRDNWSKCSPAREVQKVRVGGGGAVRDGKRSDTYFAVNTRYQDPYQRRKEIQTDCLAGANPRGTTAMVRTLDADFYVVSVGGLGRDWADYALNVATQTLGGVLPCTFLATYPDYGKSMQPITSQTPSNKQIAPTPKPTTTKPTPEKTITCRIEGKSYKIVGVNPKCPPSGPTANSPRPTASPKATTSEADRNAKIGCSSFPAAIVRLQNASGSTYNKAVVSAQEASFYIIDAALLDFKYEGLRNAQKIIAQYVQDVGWGGKGYVGDINTVRTALATFNMACNSNLKIG